MESQVTISLAEYDRMREEIKSNSNLRIELLIEASRLADERYGNVVKHMDDDTRKYRNEINKQQAVYAQLLKAYSDLCSETEAISTIKNIWWIKILLKLYK